MAKHRLHVRLQRTIDDSYDIEIGISFKRIANDIIRRWPEASFFIISDSNIHGLYGKAFATLLRNHGRSVSLLTFPAGEKQKNRHTKERLEDELLKQSVERSSLIIALGGGVTGDIAGFVSATMLRGVPYVHLPTTLLAQVDSSVGGKVAVDHPSGKNLIGAFYQPKKVYIDVSTLQTLPDREYRCGLAEVIKYGIALDKNLFLYLERNIHRILNRNNACLEYIIRKCCALKKGIVERDERESGLRRILNFGHTIGHGIESASGFRLNHGEAVAIGMAVEAKISSAIQMTNDIPVQRLTHLLRQYGLPVEIPGGITLQTILSRTAHDKKAVHGTVLYTLLTGVGRAEPGVAVPSTTIIRSLSL
jgi:3-dehydroquinate synthase